MSAGPFQQRAAFKQFAKGAGKISFNDFRDTLKDNFSMDITGHLRHLSLVHLVLQEYIVDAPHSVSVHHSDVSLCPDDECTAMFAVYDTNLNGSLEYKEFCRLVIKPDFCSVQTW